MKIRLLIVTLTPSPLIEYFTCYAWRERNIDLPSLDTKIAIDAVPLFACSGACHDDKLARHGKEVAKSFSRSKGHVRTMRIV